MKECKSGNCLSKATVATLAISAVTLIGGAILAACLYAKVDNMHKVLVESQFGSASNFEKVFEAKMTEEVKKQLDEQTENMLKELKKKEEGPTPLTQEEIKEFLGYTPVFNDKTADFLILEYADFRCGHCKHFHDEGVLKGLSDQKVDVAVALRAVPIFDGSQAAAYGAYCAAKMGDTKTYYAYLDKGFEAQATSSEEVLAFAEALNLDKNAFSQCLEDGDTAKTVEAVFEKAAKRFDVRGTPANIIINTKTGKYEVVPGAAPQSYFEDALEKVK